MSASPSDPAPVPTPETLSRHELNGLAVRVVDASNADAIGISGRVVRETERTLVIEGVDGRGRQVPKKGATFEFALPAADEDDESGDAGTGESGPDTGTGRTDERTPTYVTVEGVHLEANPARRTERKRRSKWR